MVDDFKPSKSSNALCDISLNINDCGGVNFIKLRAVFEQWEKEAEEGKQSSQTLIDMLFNLDKLLKVILKNSKDFGA